MKAIYINRYGRPAKKHTWIYFLLLFLGLLLLAARIAAPFVIESYINKQGADERGYAYRVGDVDLKLMRGQVALRDIRVFNARSQMNFAEASTVAMNFDWADLLRGNKIFEVKGDVLNFMLSKDLFEEINRIKNEAKEKTGVEFYLDRVVAFFDKINVRQTDENTSRTILTLTDSKINLKDLGVGNINEKTEFSVEAKIAEGGRINLKGKTTVEAENTPWQIKGNMSGIQSDVLEKMAGDKLPIEIQKSNINAAIVAHSAGGKIEGTLTPDIKEFKLREDKKEGPVKRTIARVSNFVLKKVEGEDEEIKFEVPFTLRENFELNFQETINKIISNRKKR